MKANEYCTKEINDRETVFHRWPRNGISHITEEKFDTLIQNIAIFTAYISKEVSIRQGTCGSNWNKTTALTVFCFVYMAEEGEKNDKMKF